MKKLNIINSLGSIFLILILIIALLLRFYKLNVIPAGLTNDEANTGYDAYSMLLTLKDQWGEFLPTVSFKGFGDYRAPLLTYIIIPFIKVFGLNEWGLRIPSALIGSMSVLAIYYLTKILTGKREIGLYAAVAVAVNPWHVAMSRIAIESNLSVLLLCLALISFIGGFKKPFLFILSSVLFCLTLYTYSGNILFSPMVVAVLIYAYRAKFSGNFKNHYIAGFMIAFIILLPLLFYGNSNPAARRFSQIGFLNDKGVLNDINETRGACQGITSGFFCRIIINKPAFYLTEFLSNYISHFSVRQLFIEGSQTQLSVLYPRGLFYYVQMIFIILGMYFVFQNRRKNGYEFLLLYFFIAPVPDALTGSGHFSRFFISYPVWPILSGLGVSVFFRSYLPKIFKTGIMVFAVYEIILFVTNYFMYFPLKYSRYSQYGYKELVGEVSRIRTDYSGIYISNYVNDTKQYIYFLLYGRYDPGKFQQNISLNSETDSDGWYRIKRLDNIIFVPSMPPVTTLTIKDEKRVLLIGAPQELPITGSPPVFIIKDLEGKSIFNAVSVDKFFVDNEIKKQNILQLR